MTDKPQKAPTRQKLFNIVGESFETETGIPRQTVVLAIEPGERVSLVREPDNPHDPNSVLVIVGGHDIGHLARVDAETIAPALDEGIPYRAQVHKIDGGIRGFPTSGVVVSIAWLGKELPRYRPRDDEQEDYRENRARRVMKNSKPQKSGCLGLITFMCIGALGLSRLL